MVGVLDGTDARHLGVAAAPLPPPSVVSKETIKLQRREMFLPYAHSGPSTINRSGGTKRPLSRAPDRPARSSVGRVSVDFISDFVNMICMRREDKFPTTDLERLELGPNYMPAVPLTTPAKLHRLLKMSST